MTEEKNSKDAVRDYYENTYYGVEKKVDWEWYDVKGQYKKLIKTLGKPVSGKVLDVSCGSGELLSFINDSFDVESFGFDLSETAIRKAKTKFDSPHFFAGNGEEMPVKDDSFDFIFCLGSLEHFIRINGGVSEISRVLKQEGLVLLTLPNEFWLNYVLLALSKGVQPTQNQVQEYFTTRTGWSEILELNGLRIVKVDKQNIPFDPRLHRMLGNPVRLAKNFYYLILSILPANFCSHFIFVCKKK